MAESDDFLDFSDPSEKAEHSIDRLKAYNAGYQSKVSNYFFSSPVFKGSSDTRVYVGSLVTDVFNKETLTDEELNTLFQTAYDKSVLAINSGK